MNRTPHRILAGIELTIIGLYSAYLITLGTVLILEAEANPTLVIGIIFIVLGCFGLGSIVKRELIGVLYFGWGVHIVLAYVLTFAISDELQKFHLFEIWSFSFLASNFVLPVLIFYLVRSNRPPGKTLALLFLAKREEPSHRHLSFLQALALGVMILGGAALLLLGGTAGLLLFAVYILAPIIGIYIVWVVGREIVRELRGKERRTVISPRRIKLKRTMVRPAKRFKYWTVMEDHDHEREED